MEILEWLLYNTVIPLSPVPLVLIGGWLLGRAQHLFAVIRDGQLFFYCTGTIAILLRDLGRKQGYDGKLVEGTLYVMLIYCAFFFGVAVLNREQVQEREMGHTSTWTVLLITVFVLVTRYNESLL
jgi:hypothetical protein